MSRGVCVLVVLLVAGVLAGCALPGDPPSGDPPSGDASPGDTSPGATTQAATSGEAPGAQVARPAATTPVVSPTHTPMPSPTSTRLPTATPSPSATSSPVPPTSTPTETPTSSPIPPSRTSTPTSTTTPSSSPTPLPPSRTPVPAATATRPPPTIPSPLYRFVAAGPARADPSFPCPGCPLAHAYIVGHVRDAAGNPLAGVRLVCYNDWHRYPVVASKEGGEYDFAIIQADTTWFVVALDESDEPISAEVAVRFDPNETCRYILDWQRVD